jgi:hypothetical protein
LAQFKTHAKGKLWSRMMAAWGSEDKALAFCVTMAAMQIHYREGQSSGKEKEKQTVLRNAK